jgi:hypothetical protein
MIRGLLFFFVTLPAGRGAAGGAMLAEMAFRGVVSGFFGAMTQQLSLAEPPWAAGLVAMVILPAIAQLLELLVHWLRGTPRLAAGLMASTVFTIVSLLFNLYIQRHGVLLVGDADCRSLVADLAAMPRMIAGFVALPFRVVAGMFQRR